MLVSRNLDGLLFRNMRIFSKIWWSLKRILQKKQFDSSTHPQHCMHINKGGFSEIKSRETVFPVPKI